MSKKRLHLPLGSGGAWASANQVAHLQQKVNVLLRELNKMGFLDMVDTADINDGAVTTPKIANNAVTDEKLPSDVIFPTETVAAFRGGSVNAATGFDEDQNLPLPVWKYAALLNGEYFVVSDHADFDITGDLTIGMDFLLDAGWAAVGMLVDKLSTSPNSGFRKRILANRKLSYSLNGAAARIDVDYVFDTGQRYKILSSYDASAQEVAFYILSLHSEVEGAFTIEYRAHEIARANNTTQTGCTLTGTIPSAIVANATNLGIGAVAATGANPFLGYLSNVFIAPLEFDSVNVFSNFQGCAGWWPLAHGPYDISRNEHHATETGFTAVPVYREEPLLDLYGDSYSWIRRLPEGLAATEY